MAVGKRVNAGRQRPKLGQNFLADNSAAERIVKTLGDVSDRTVLEIGPGKGALSDLLAVRAGRMVAIEVDRVLAAKLRMKYAARGNVEIIEGDVLSIDLESVLRRRPGPLSLLEPPEKARARVLGNIPYYITSDILLRLFSFHGAIEIAIIMTQKEVADRVAAKPGTRDYGLLSATAQLYARVEKLFTLPPDVFSPPPKVESTVLRLTMAPRLEELAVQEEDFINFLRLSFAQKRKTLLNNLKPRYPEATVRGALISAAVRADARAESLPLEKAAAVFRQLAGSEKIEIARQ